MTPSRLTIHEATALLRTRALSAQELTRAVLDRIHATDARTRSYLTVCEPEALAQAETADRRLAAGDSIPPLCGTNGTTRTVPTSSFPTRETTAGMWTRWRRSGAFLPRTCAARRALPLREAPVWESRSGFFWPWAVVIGI